MQENLFSLPADGIRAEAVSTASGSWLWSFSGKPQGSSSALCPVENRVYFGIAGEKALYSVRLRHASRASSPARGALGIPEKLLQTLRPNRTQNIGSSRQPIDTR